MTEAIKREVEEALASPDLNEAVRLLKRGLRRDPYWEWGHRTLGDVYLVGIDHASYALVEYRKLRKTAERFTDADRLRLIWAYIERGFEDKASDVLRELDEDSLPGTLELLDETYDPSALVEEFKATIDSTIESDADEYFEKYFRQGTDHFQAGNMYEAQQAYEKALEYRNDSNTKLELARCLIQRSKFPEALEYLKSIQDVPEVSDEAEELMTDVYQRLGLYDLFEDDDSDDGEANASRKAS